MKIDKEYIKSLGEKISDYSFYHNKINDNIETYALGCESSEWDAEKIARDLSCSDINEKIVVFNTCCVTEDSHIICQKIASRLKLIYPDRKIFVTGCGVTYNYEDFNKYGITILQKDKFSISNYGFNRNCKCTEFGSENHGNVGIIKIQDGCYNNCTYCIIHKLRSHYVMPYEKIKIYIENMLRSGKDTFQIFGTEICSYYSDKMHLTDLCKRILKDYPSIKMLYLHSLDPASSEIDKLIELIKTEPRINNTLKLEVQSCSDTILKSMNRKHDVNRLREIKNLCEDKVRIEFELMVGFPGETEELFLETFNNIKDLKPINCLTHIFSPRKGTPAYDMDNKVPIEVSERRRQIIHDEIKKINNFVFDKDHCEIFFKFRPENINGFKIKEYDLYENDDLCKAFKDLSEKDTDDIIIVTSLNNEKDINDLNINIKLLTESFGIKVIININITDDNMEFFTENSCKKFNTNFIDFSYNCRCFMNLSFDKLITASEEKVVDLFKLIQDTNSYDLELLTQELIKSGNKKYLNAISQNMEVYI